MTDMKKEAEALASGRAQRWNRGLLLVGAGLMILVVSLALYSAWRDPAAGGPTIDRRGTGGGAPDFVGSRACAGCHAEQHQAWLGSHHQLAMQPASETSVLGDFNQARLADGDGATFFRDGDAFMVRTTGPQGTVRDYPIHYTFGVEPLQQYLIALPGGRLQAFGTAWDSRPREQGGQRWFALYPESQGQPASPLHWSAIDQNWNGACAHCHSTGLRKHYDAKTQRYATTFSEVSVGCEACHGPGSAHLAWARDPHGHADIGPGHGLSLDFGKDARGHWRYDASAGRVIGQGPRSGALEVETCARCHALGTPIHEDPVHGQPVSDEIRVALLDPELYFPDGQIKGEVFEYGSFIQSRMFHAGVTCANCHEPHSARLRAEGNGLCTQCHQAAAYDTPAHSHHPAGSAGSQCVACHMPERTYMRIDGRRDHSIRVPRPDLSASLGTPNACNQCHQEQSPAWAAGRIDHWRAVHTKGLQRFGPALRAAAEGAPGARQSLERLIGDPEQPAIARATALSLLADSAAGNQIDDAGSLFRQAADDRSPLVRRAAARHPSAALALLDDPVRAVRIAAAESLAALAAPPSSRAASQTLQAAAGQYRQAQALNADRPEAHLGLAGFHAAQGDLESAQAELETALALDPAFVPAAINLADFHRAQGHDDRAEAVLREARRHAPEAPALSYALGLLEVRGGHHKLALEALAAARRQAPDNPEYAYVYALALNERGDSAGAIEVLEASLGQHPFHRPSIAALASFYDQLGQPNQAMRYQRMLRQWRQEARQVP